LDFGRVLRGARFLLIVAAVAIPATWLLYHCTSLRDAALGGTVFGIICVVALANAVWEMFRPPEFAIDVTSNTASFEFRDRARAEEFAAANGMSFAPSPPNGA
jgi:O-antigen ligase